MEDEVMEQIRTRLAAATSAAAALAKSLEALDGNTLQTLELWLAKQEGDLRCGDCRAQMPRGKSSSVCIACGSKRPPLPNTVQFDFRVSFAFLQFLETIHPPLKAAGSNRETAHSPSKVSLGENTVETSQERTEDISKLDGAPHLDESSTGFEDTAKTDDVSTGSEDMAKADDVPHLDQSSTSFEDTVKLDDASADSEDMAKPDDAPHHSSSGVEDMAKLGGAPRLDQSTTGFEDVAKLDGAAHSSTNSEDMTKLDGALHSDQSSTNLESAEREPELAFGSATSTEAVSSWDTEWDYPTSHSLSAKIQPEESAQSEISLKSPKEVTFANPQVPEYDLSFFDSFGGMGTKDGNVTTETDADATFWDFQDASLVNSRLARISAVERFASDISAFTTITDADSDSEGSSLDVLPPPTPPLDLFGEIGASNGQNVLVGSLKSPEMGNVTGLESGFQPEAHETPEDDFEEEDWDDAEFVGSQPQPANEAPEPTSHVDLLPFSSGSSPALATISFSSSFISRDVSMDKDKFLLDQSSNLLGATPGNFTDFGTRLETLITTDSVQKSGAGLEDPFKSVHGRSLSFGDSEQRPSDIDDLFKRSVSHGNLQGKDMAEGDELLKALQAPSIPKPAPRSSEPGEDILNFLNLRPAPSQVNTPQPQAGVSSTAPLRGRSSSFGTLELVPDEQSDEMFQFFHTRSHSAGSSATKIEDSSGGKDILTQFSGSTPKAPPTEVNDDPFSFIHAAIAPSTQPEAAADTNIDDDDDSFEWHSSATTPAETSAHQPEAVPASSQQDLFQWTPPSKPSSSPGKPSGSSSGLLSLAGGLLPSQIRTASSMEDDLFAALSRNTSGGAQAGTRPQLATTEIVDVSNPGDDSEDEFSDFVSTGALPASSPASAPPPAAGHATTQPPAFDVSFFEAAQPNPSEKRNMDFFGDLMGLNFTNA